RERTHGGGEVRDVVAARIGADDQRARLAMLDDGEELIVLRQSVRGLESHGGTVGTGAESEVGEESGRRLIRRLRGGRVICNGNRGGAGVQIRLRYGSGFARRRQRLARLLLAVDGEHNGTRRARGSRATDAHLEYVRVFFRRAEALHVLVRHG